MYLLIGRPYARRFPRGPERNLFFSIIAGATEEIEKVRVRFETPLAGQMRCQAREGASCNIPTMQQRRWERHTMSGRLVRCRAAGTRARREQEISIPERGARSLPFRGGPTRAQRERGGGTDAERNIDRVEPDPAPPPGSAFGRVRPPLKGRDRARSGGVLRTHQP